METVGIIVGIILGIVFMFKRWFWLIAFGTGSVSACLGLVTSLLHLQVLQTIGYMVVMIVCWLVAREIAERYQPSDERETHAAAPLKHDKESPDWSPH